MRSFIRVFIVTGICVIILRIFFIASFKVPTSSMEPAIFSGDYILVNKLIPGARLVKRFNFLNDKIKPDLYRMKGLRKIRRNDILVFNLPYSNEADFKFDINTYYVKRCVAISGDTFCIENGKYKVKGVEEILGNRAQQRDLLEIIRCFPNDNKYKTFPNAEEYEWTLENMGPFYIPRKDECLMLNVCNINLYKALIKYETEKNISINESHILLGDSIIDRYTFKTNYYFMAGDFAINSWDSRYWGLLPEDQIIGKAEFVWKSKNMKTGKYNWSRFFSVIK